MSEQQQRIKLEQLVRIQPLVSDLWGSPGQDFVSEPPSCSCLFTLLPAECTLFRLDFMYSRWIWWWYACHSYTYSRTFYSKTKKKFIPVRYANDTYKSMILHSFILARNKFYLMAFIKNRKVGKHTAPLWYKNTARSFIHILQCALDTCLWQLNSRGQPCALLLINRLWDH